MSKKEHWENVFSTKKENEVSWYQTNPETSIKAILKSNLPKNAKIIDIGGGDSYLIDKLLDLGYTNLYLLDISENAINRIKNRLKEKSQYVSFIVSDILEFDTDETFDFWHDRASFHFLTSKEEIEKYKAIAEKYTNASANLFIGTFSESGPLKCSGLEITQYSESKLDKIFSDTFLKMECFTENHQTPFETVQNFIFCHFKKKP
ncbi:class I SAM-dependent methyltransferase [Flavobacterium nitrogenifigens]|uniref:Methyltransferase domain-containing protein n=1 Tax=Flavobacterium nitrogenifigens TaxID=1617283 RepID=A0A521BLN1_9FLAO|nr:class I SAM-dependent methyltransferase [Flavobacterium nitrogenifigens]SMO48023.1 Methyltransferase domain-containing protein [Flavobacterium nitrogenifigens]